LGEYLIYNKLLGKRRVMKIKKHIGSVVLATVLCLAGFASQAASVIHTVKTTVNGGLFDGEIGKALLVFDSNNYDANTGTVSAWHGASKFEIFGQTFSVTDGAAPVLTFDTGLANGLLTSLDFTIFDNNPTDILEANVDFIRFADDIQFTSSGSKGKFYSGTTTVVPLPASAWLFVSGLLGLVGMQRRKS
jgi:hypothetical protein